MIIVTMGEKIKHELYDWQTDPELAIVPDRPSLGRALLAMWPVYALVLAVLLLIGFINYQTKPHKYFVSYEYSYRHGIITGSGRRIVSHTNGPVTLQNAENFLRNAEACLARSEYAQLASDPYGDFSICILYYQEIERPLLGWIFYFSP